MLEFILLFNSTINNGSTIYATATLEISQVEEVQKGSVIGSFWEIFEMDASNMNIE